MIGRGLVSRTAHLAVQRSATFPFAPVVVPDTATGARTRLFTAYVEESGTVKERLRATVRFEPGPPSTLRVLAWSVLT